ncbi:MAG: polysaccharide biosynthesis C-terminal domain-containing protein, partial [Oscillospiraceae bacterium]
TTSLVGAVINIILSGLLVGKFGIQGVSFATFVSYFVCYVIRLIDTRRYIKYRVNFLKDLINLAILGGMSVSIMLEPKQNIIYLAIGAGLIFILNIGTLIKTAKQLLKKRK